MVRIAVSGSRGRMGTRILALANNDPGVEVTGSFDAGEDAAAAMSACDCLIEFTTPEATLINLALCEEGGKAVVIGTTGLTEDARARVKAAAERIPVVLSPNMSVGVNLLFKIAEEAARTLGPDYTVEIVEAHHVNKKDAPSGTAKELASIVKSKRGETEIPIDSIREEDIVGEHTVTFESPVDCIELTHSAKTRDIFAEGALAAAKWVAGKPAGLYTMKEVLGL